MTEFLLGTALLAGGRLTILPDSSAEPLRKPCEIPKGVALAAGERVLLMKHSGGYMIVAVYPA